VDTTEQTSFPPIAADAPDDLTPNNPPWNSVLAIGLWIFSVVMIMIVPVFFLLPYLISSGVINQGSEKLADFSITDPFAVILQMSAIVPAHLLTLAAGWLVVTGYRRHSFTEMLGFKSGGIRWFHHLLILIAFFGLAAFVSQFFPEAEKLLTEEQLQQLGKHLHEGDTQNCINYPVKFWE